MPHNSALEEIKIQNQKGLISTVYLHDYIQFMTAPKETISTAHLISYEEHENL